MSNLASKARYIAPYEFIINRSIEEWDIEKANISVLRDTNFFTEEQYEQYRAMDKKQREVAIGYLIKRILMYIRLSLLVYRKLEKSSLRSII
jgi:hypothetical protein